MHELRLETWSSFTIFFESYRGTWVVTSKSNKSRSTSNQVGNAFQTLFFTYIATNSQNSEKRYRVWDRFQMFSELMILKLWLFPKKSHSSTNKNTHFLTYKSNHFCVIPNDCRKQHLVFKQVNTFLAPPIWLPPPKFLVWIRFFISGYFMKSKWNVSHCEQYIHKYRKHYFIQRFSFLVVSHHQEYK